MKILMLTPYLPYPPASGGQIRTLNLLKYLSKHHDVTLVSLYKNNREKKYASELKPYCSKVYVCKRAEKPWQPAIIAKALFTPKPLLIVRNFSAEAEHTLRNLLSDEKFDVIHAETFYIMPHLPQTDVPILLVEQTIEYQVYKHFVNNLPFVMRPFFSTDVVKLKYWERYYWKKATMVATVSETDLKVIKKDEPAIKPVIVPNGAGDDMFVENLTAKRLNQPTFLFQGNFFWLQNREAARYLITNVYPLLRRALPRSKIIISGQETGRIDMKPDKNLEFIEINPSDGAMVKKLYLEASLFIAPIFGPGGTRLKILAAMASGLPVISTKTGIEGLAAKNNEHVLIANTPMDFVKKTMYIISHRKQYERIRYNAHKLVKEKYSWSSISKELEVLYQTLKEKHENRN